MSGEWLKTEGLVEYAKKVLTKSGVPLEIQTAQVCRDFVDASTKKYPNINFTSERLIYYQDETGQVPREIDRKVTIEATFRISDNIYWFLTLHIPIECKYRENLEAIGFPVEATADTEAEFTLFGESGSKLFKQLAFTQPGLFSGEQIVLVRFLEFDVRGDKLNLKKLHDDTDHVYKAGLSLYDYIKTQVPPMPIHYEDRLLKEMKLINEEAIGVVHPKLARTQWNVRADQIIAAKGIDDYRRYNDAKVQDGNHLFITNIYAPVMCVNSPLYTVSFNEDHEIESFTSKTMLISGVIVPSWPEATPYYVINPVKESLLMITNPEHLYSVLTSLFEWYDNMVTIVLDDLEGLERTPLETTIFQHVLNLGKDTKVWPGLL